MHQQSAVARAGIAGDGGTLTVGDASMSRTIRDAAGRMVVVGDTVGGTTIPPRAITVTGEVTEIDDSRVCVTVATVSGSRRSVPAAGERVWIPARQMFLIHAQAPRTQQLRTVRGQVSSMRWSGKFEHLPLAAKFAGGDLIGALADPDGWMLSLRVRKGNNRPDLVLPGWFIVRPTARGRFRACDPVQYANTYVPTAPDSGPQ